VNTGRSFDELHLQKVVAVCPQVTPALCPPPSWPCATLGGRCPMRRYWERWQHLPVSSR
jgi:hypothetical protein